MNAQERLPGVWQIESDMGVCMTLLVGSERALLVDTGYGLEDVQAFVRTITDLPLQVMLTHCHHDHVLGSRWFERAAIMEADAALFAVYTSDAFRSKVAQQAEENGIPLPRDFLTAPMAELDILQDGCMELGGLTAQVIACPGHTPGSAVVYVPQRQLLLTGDDWNPCTWVFFPESLPVETYRENVRGLLKLPFAHVLCSHRTALYDRSKLEAFLNGLSDGALRGAEPVDMNWEIDTRQLTIGDQWIVFDWNKSALAKKEKER